MNQHPVCIRAVALAKNHQRIEVREDDHRHTHPNHTDADPPLDLRKFNCILAPLSFIYL